MKLRTCIWALRTEAEKDEGSQHDSTAHQATEKTIGDNKKGSNNCTEHPLKRASNLVKQDLLP
jgi:uncharacterized membrane protein